MPNEQGLLNGIMLQSKSLIHSWINGGKAAKFCTSKLKDQVHWEKKSAFRLSCFIFFGE